MRRFFLILALVFTVTTILQPQSQAGIFIGFPIPLPVPVFYGPAYYSPGYYYGPYGYAYYMLDRTGGTGTGHVAIGGTIEFRLRRKSAATYCTEDMTSWHRRSLNGRDALPCDPV